MKFKELFRKYSTWVFVLIVVAESSILFYRHFFARFDIQHVTPNDGFVYSDSLSCEVVYSTFQRIGESLFDDYYLEPTFRIVGLESDTPKLKWSGFEYDLKKTVENESMIILQTVSIDSRDTQVQVIQLFKEKGTFVRSFMGGGQYFGAREFLHPDGFQFLIAQKGRCR